MLSAKKKSLKYALKKIQKTDTGDVELLDFKTFKYEGASVKRYFNTLQPLFQLNKAERLLLDFITEEMDENNLVTNSTKLKEKFNTMLSNAKQNVYKDNYINQCFTTLLEHNFILAEKERGLYQVNPLYFFKGTEKDRERRIRRNLEIKSKVFLDQKRRAIILRKGIF